MRRKLKFIVTFLVVIGIVLSALYMTNNKMFIPTVKATSTPLFGNVTSYQGCLGSWYSKSLARSSNGTLYAVYRNNTDINISESTDNGGNWTERSIIADPTLTYGQDGQTIAIDSKNNIYVFWYGVLIGDLLGISQIQFRMYNTSNESWDNPSYLALGLGIGDAAYNPSMVIDSSDVVHIIYFNSSVGTLWHVSCANGTDDVTNESEINPGGSGIGQGTLAINSTDGLNVILPVSNVNGTFFIQYTSSTDGGNTWSSLYDVTTDTNISSVEIPTIAIDQNDIMHLVFTNYTYDDSLPAYINGTIQYMSFNGSSWSTPLDVSEKDAVPVYDIDGMYSESAVSVDDANAVHVIWYENVSVSLAKMMHNSSTSSVWLSNPEELFEFDVLSFGGNYVVPNLIHAFYPTQNSTPNIPTTGYAFLFQGYVSGLGVQNITFYSNATWGEIDNPPVITNIFATPNSISTGGYVNITADVVDTDTTNVSLVKVNISGPGGFTTVNQSMNLYSGNTYYYNTTYTITGTYNFYVWANDTADLSSNSSNSTFEVVSNYSPTISNPNPANHSWGNNLSLTWNVTIEDAEGDDFNWTISVDGIGFNSDNYSTNGSKDVILSGLSPNANYTVYVNVTDGNGSGTWNNETYWFLTNRVAVLSNPNPANQSTGVSLSQPNWNITIEDPDGDTFNYSIETYPDVGGSYGYDNNNGSKSAVLAGLVASTNYTVYINVTDNGTDVSVNETFWFITTSATNTVYVNSSYTGATPDYGIINFSTIHEAVENVTVGGNVIVYPGYYVENVFIAKQINITGSYTNWRPSINSSVANNHTITIQGTYNVTIEGLNISNVLGKAGSYNAIQIGTITADSYYTHIENCTLKNSYAGILIRGGDHTLISNCTIFGNTYGMDLVTTTVCFILHNNINNNSFYGVYINSVSTVNIIDNNSIAYNTLEGIRILGLCTNNWIFHNNFINNNIGSKQVSDSLLNTNTWNLLYPQCGNYWGDWDQPSEGAYDNWSGSGQNIVGSDGIVDTTSPNPYNFTSNQDNYPFIQPYNGTPAQATPILSYETPTNNSINVSILLINISINISSDYAFCYNITGSFLNDTFNNGTWVTTGNFTANVSNILTYNTQYQWFVNVTDGNKTTNATYYFWTNQAPNITGYWPTNGSTILILQPYCNVTVNDTEGDTIDICFFQNTSGVWVLNQSNVSVGNGTYFWNYTLANTLGNTYWWMITVNDSYTNLTYIYHFSLSISAPKSWKNLSWWNLTIQNTIYPISTWTLRITNQTHGGWYNITIRFENETEGINHVVDLTALNTGINKFIVHYDDSEDYVYFNNNGIYSSHYNTTQGYYLNNKSGNFSILISKWAKTFEFRWNDSLGRTYYCSRLEVPTTGNVTMYIRTDLPVYGDTASTLPGSLVKYSVSFNDETGNYRYPNNPYAVIYSYNSSGVKQIIHSEYFDASSRVYPWLVYGEKYFIGVYCDVDSNDRIGALYASSEIDQLDIRIPFEAETHYNIFDLITIVSSWYAGGFYVNYTDTTASTIWIEFTVYNFTNDTLVHVENISGFDTKQFTFTVAEGCSLTENYKFQINCSLDALVNPFYAGYRTTGRIPIYYTQSITNNQTIDNILTIIFGGSPVHDADDDTVFVPWTYLLISIGAFVVLVTFGKLNSFIGGVATGLFLLLAGVAITGITPLFANYSWWEGASVSVIGVFIIAISIIALLGGVEK